jgi:uncharacterized UPF0160 family protein
MKRSVGIHDGTFHADEVTACALLIATDRVDRSRIYRTRDPKLLASCEYVCDVGGLYDPSTKRFDHHQAEYQGDFSSAGMVLAYLRDEGYLDAELAAYLRDSLVAGVDAIDNGAYTPPPGLSTFSAVVSNFLPPSYAPGSEKLEEAFHAALTFVLGHIERLMARYREIAAAKGAVKAAMEQGETCLFFDEPLPWLDAFFTLGGEHHPALFIIMPTKGEWKLRGIPPSYEERMRVRLPLPESWAGLHDEALEAASGIQGAVFCHKGRFISVWKTREAAMEALKQALVDMGSDHGNHF